MRHLLENAGLLVVASHSLALLRTYCTRGLLLRQGQVHMIGELEDAIQTYAGLH